MIDMTRDITMVREKEQPLDPEVLKAMPINGMARKAHYLFDNYKYEEEGRLIDNSR